MLVEQPTWLWEDAPFSPRVLSFGSSRHAAGASSLPNEFFSLNGGVQRFFHCGSKSSYCQWAEKNLPDLVVGLKRLILTVGVWWLVRLSHCRSGSFCFLCLRVPFECDFRQDAGLSTASFTIDHKYKISSTRAFRVLGRLVNG